MENMLPTIKVYKIDYDFIVKNYLNPEMWKKTWTLFQYKKFVVTLELSSIECQQEKIWFRIEVKDYDKDRKYFNNWWKNTDKNSVRLTDYSLKVNDISFLKRAIETAVLKTIKELEEQYIRSLEEYRDLEENYENEKGILENIAKEFLDNEGVTNEEIREVYIDSYVNNNTKIDILKQKLLNDYQFTMFTDFYLVFAHSTKNPDTIEKYEEIASALSNAEGIKQEVEEYLEYMETEDFENDMSEKLESI